VPNRTLDQTFAELRAHTPGQFFVPVRMAVHGENGVVLYGFGGLVYQPAPLRNVYTPTGGFGLSAAGEEPWLFDAESLVTSGGNSHTRVQVLNNVAFDANTNQSFLVNRAESLSVTIGSAIRKGGEREDVLLRVALARGVTPAFTAADLVVADIPLIQDGLFLRGAGSLVWDPAATAIWTVSLLDAIEVPIEPN